VQRNKFYDIFANASIEHGEDVSAASRRRVEDLVEIVKNKGTGIAEILQRLAPFDFHPPRGLHVESHRTVHEKLEVLNQQSFAGLLADEFAKRGAPNKRIRS